MKLPNSQVLRRSLWAAAAVLAVGAAWLTSARWLPLARNWLGSGESAVAGANDTEGSGHPPDGHAHDEADTLHLSEQARKNIDLEVGPIRIEPYERTITVPAVVVEQPGRTRIEIAAPMTGVVTDIAIRRGETVRSGDVLFRLRLTHEDLIDAQTEFLRNLAQLDVARREIARLAEITREGITAGEVVLEREYERDKLMAGVIATREALRLHGLSEEQVVAIERSRRLVREVTIVAPLLHDDHSVHDDSEAWSGSRRPVALRTSAVSIQDRAAPAGEPPSAADRDAAGPADEHSHETRVVDFVVQEITAHRGEAVQTGAALCVLADMERLFIEGRAFEQDAAQLAEAARQKGKITALVQSQNGRSETIPGLDILYVSNEIDPETRALYFYVALDNMPVRDETTPEGRRFVTWRFKPGQRLQLRVPVEVWSDVIVLPVDALAQEGPEFYVFVENGDHFDRRPVHVRYRDQHNAVVANDGSVFPGEKVARSAAHQLQMALKNQAGGGIDPHAGHHH